MSVAYGKWDGREVPTVLWFVGGKFFGPLLLAQVPIFRERALGGLPAGAPRGLAGTIAFEVAEGESLVAALGRSFPRRRWRERLMVRVPAHWSEAVARLRASPRQVPTSVVLTTMVRGKAALPWCFLGAGLLALTIVLKANLLPEMRSDRTHLQLWRDILLFLVGIGSLRFGVLRLYEAGGLARLLAKGEVVFATPQPQVIPGPFTIAVATTAKGGLGVETPRPEVVGAQQGILVSSIRRRRVVVAWDLLPFVPTVRADGSFAEVPSGHVLPWLAFPIGVFIALAVLVTALFRVR